jgi:hypothetical protein
MTVYAADNPIRIGGLVFMPAHFTCKATGVKLTLKSCTIFGEGAEKDVYVKGKQPVVKPTAVRCVGVLISGLLQLVNE